MRINRKKLEVSINACSTVHENFLSVDYASSMVGVACYY